MSGVATGSMWLGIDPAALPPQHIRGSDIIRAVLNATQVRRNDLMSPRRTRNIAEARQLAYFFMHHFTSLSLPQIGRMVGGKDHSTVMHGIRRVTMEPEVFGARTALIANELGVKV
jgi:chromosomal replication initiation ATPase DnaA